MQISTSPHAESFEQIKRKITHRLQEVFSPTELSIIDESEQHRGHKGWRADTVTHLRIRIVSSVFEGKTRLVCHRLVYACLQEELAGSLHALALETRAPPLL